MNSVLVVVPLYNHGTTIRQVVKDILELHSQVLVVDDGSTDGGIDSLQGLACSVLQHDANKGKGAAILSAAAYAEQHGNTHIVTIDADGQHAASDLTFFLEAIRQVPNAVHIGARDFSVPNVPGASRFGRQFSRFWLRVQTGYDVSDPQSGFRAYPVSMLTALSFRETRYAFEIEVLAKAAWAGFPLCSLPISVYYPKPEDRVSHFRKLKDNVEISLLNTRLTMRSMVPLPHTKFDTDADGTVSVIHPLRSLRTLLADQTTPFELAISGALGMILGTLPLIGLHSISILLIAGYFRLNKVCGLAVSQLCIPPFVPAICVEVGFYMRHGHWLTEFSLETIGYQALERVWEWIIGSLVVAPVFAAGIALLIYFFALGVRRGLTGRASHE